MMRKVICVSFPRSGHHLLINILLKYFSSNVNYPLTSGENTDRDCNRTLIAGKLVYCEYYNHCNTMPCIDKNTNFIKNHDFSLNLDILPDYYYIILYRKPIEAIISLYEFTLKDSNKNSFFGNNVGQTKKDWENFSKEAIYFFKSFIKKWMINNKNRYNGRLLFVTYEDLINNPKLVMNQVIKFIEPQEGVDHKLLKESINNAKIKKNRNILEFKYYDQLFFTKLENIIKNELKFLYPYN
jgi:hypothetical protein